MSRPNPYFSHVVITGASSGIGEALARAYAAFGSDLALSGRNAQRLEAVAAACRDKGVQVETAVIDVADKGAMETWLTDLDTRRPVDLVIANAGISAGTGGVMSAEDPKQVRGLFDVNLFGVLNTVEPLLARMQARGSGHVALMSSLAGLRGFPGAPAYCASKAAVRVYGEALRSTLRTSGVKVSVICPGFVKSRMTDANDFPMPFMVPADRAANIIMRGLEKNRGRIAFPWPVHVFMWLLTVLPDGLVQIMLRNVPAKKQLPKT